MTAQPDILDRLYRTILSRRGGDPAASYSAKLFAKGRAKIAQKVGEEAVEVAIAATSEDASRIAEESADLLFHLMLLWADAGIAPTDIYEILAKREGISGIAEKAARKED